jgi:hypothetical protein
MGQCKLHHASDYTVTRLYLSPDEPFNNIPPLPVSLLLMKLIVPQSYHVKPIFSKWPSPFPSGQRGTQSQTGYTITQTESAHEGMLFPAIIFNTNQHTLFPGPFYR